MLLLKAMGQIKNINFLQISLAIFLALIPLIQIHSLSDPTLLSRQLLYIGLGIFSILLLWLFKAELIFPNSNFLRFALISWFAISALSLFYAYNFQEALYSFSKTSLYIAGIALFAGLFYSGLIQLRAISIGLMLSSGIALFYLGLEISEITSGGLNLWSQKNLYELHTVFGHKNLYSSFQLL
ncbi:MAG: hypothetical protein K9J84_09005, partial [Bacteroidia bacterium]|nr:hypothetical protein [Bacteroidia bacterium]